jgi:anti-sigma factor RsiW
MRQNGVRCSWIVEVVTDYLEGVLQPAPRRRVERHVGTCQGCAAYLAQMRSTVRLTALLRAL